MRSTGRLWSRVLVLIVVFCTGIFVLGGVEEGRAQTGPSLRSVERPLRVSLTPTYQSVEAPEGQTITELSTYLTASVPLGRRFTVQARAGYAQMGGDPFAEVQGLTDAVGRVTYAQSVGDGSIVVATTVNVPVGKSKLDADALRTTRFVSRNHYDFEVSTFSRGLSVSPRVTYAVSVSEQLAVGVGVEYQHQRGYQPNEGLTSDSLYVPGDGVGLNAGFDYRLTDISALGVDVAFKRYGADEVGGNQRFDAGNRISGTVRYLRRSGFTTLRAVARYAKWGESEYGYRFGTPERREVIPSHAMLLGSYETRLSEQVDVTVRVAGYRYEETVQADQQTFGRVYVSPSFELTEQIVVAPHGRATYGSYTGLGGGFRVEGRF